MLVEFHMVYYTLILISRYILYAKCLIWNSFLLGNIIHIILDHLEYVLIIYVNNCPTRCKTKQSIYYSASSLYMFRVSNTPIIRSTQKCNYSLQYW